MFVVVVVVVAGVAVVVVGGVVSVVVDVVVVLVVLVVVVGVCFVGLCSSVWPPLRCWPPARLFVRSFRAFVLCPPAVRVRSVWPFVRLLA